LQCESESNGTKLKRRCVVSFRLESSSESVSAAAFFNGKLASDDFPEGLKLSFTAASVGNDNFSKAPKGWEAVGNGDKF
jgi:hypothetical protein